MSDKMIELTVKQIRLANSITMILMMLTLLYSILSFAVVSNVNLISFMKSKNFINILIIFIFIYIFWDLVIKKQKNYKKAMRKPRNRPRKQKQGVEGNTIRSNTLEPQRPVSESQFFESRENFENYIKKLKMEEKK